MELDHRILQMEEEIRLLKSQNKDLQNQVSINEASTKSVFKEMFLEMRNACVIYKAIDQGEDFIIYDVNIAFESIERMDKQPLLGKRVLEAFPDAGQEILSIFKRVYTSGKAENVLFLYSPKDKESSWRANNIFKLSSGELIAVYEDITPIKRKEIELKDSEARYKALSDASNEAIFVLENGLCIDLNMKAREIFGYSTEEAMGKTILDFIAPESKELVHKKITQDYTKTYDGWCIRKNGKIFPAELKGKNFHYVGREVRISTIRDISTQKYAEIKLAKSEAKFRSYFEDHNAIKLQLDPFSRQILDANKAAEYFYGFTKEELISKSFYEINMLPRDEVDRLTKLATNQMQAICILPHRLKNGKIRDVKVYTSPIEVDGKTTLFSIIHDITEGKLAEEELKRSEARFRAFFENNGAAMLQIDPQSKRIIRANKAAQKFYGYSNGQIEKLTAYDINILSPSEIDRRIFEVMASPSQTFIFNHRLASGESCEVEVYVSPIITDKENQLFTTVYDVSEREKNKRYLEESERMLREAQGIAKIGSWDFDHKSNTVNWSDETYDIFEIDKDFPVSFDNYMGFIFPEDQEKTSAFFHQSIKSKEPYHAIHRILTKTRKVKYVEERGYTIYDENGKPSRSVGTTQDISEQKFIELDLKRSQEYLTEAQRIAKVGHFDFDLLKQEANWSDEVSRIFGFDTEHNKSSYKKYRALIHPEDIEELDKVFAQALKEKRGYTIVYRITSLDGELKYIEEKAYFEFEKNHEKRKLIGTIQDITSNHLIKKDLEESKAQLALINQNLEDKVQNELSISRQKDHLLIQQSRHAVLGEMIGNIAHQWRQPLNDVSLLVNDLEDAFAFGVLDKQYFEKTMEIVYRRLKYMSDTINDFSKMHTDDFKKEIFKPKDLIGKLIQFSAGTIKRKNIQIQFIAEKDIEVEGYPNMLSHVILNLLNNSRDVFLERDIKKPKIWITLEQKEDRYCIKVLDNGKGVESDVIDKIFDPYFTTKDKRRGSGLGLYMAKSMIEKQMQGDIRVENQREGAEFIITLDIKNEGI